MGFPDQLGAIDDPIGSGLARLQEILTDLASPVGAAGRRQPVEAAATAPRAASAAALADAPGCCPGQP